MLDDTARREYRARLQFLCKEREKISGPGAAQRRAEIDGEIAWIERTLRSATDVRGHPRPFHSAPEQARKAVSINLHRSLRTIGAYHPQLHRHLAICIRIGTSCSYSPDPPTAWITR
jgi:hypothetical protein